MEADNSTNVTTPATPAAAGSSHSWWDAGRIQIPLYSAIFLLAVTGNSLVILTLAVHQRMRTITNVFLLNLAVSDLLLGVLCMPFTLIGALLRDFVFGEVMCKLIPYLQACSVAVSAWTLVAISVERYYAICHPLRSRRWQTLSHAYHMIAVIWSGSLACMAPIAALSELKPTKQGHHKCRESWPDPDYERMYNILLDMLLLVLPLVALAATYSLITRTLRQGMELEHALRSDGTPGPCDNGQVEMYVTANGSRQAAADGCRACAAATGAAAAAAGAGAEGGAEVAHLHHTCSLPSAKPSFRAHHLPTGLRRSNAEKSLLKKRRVIKMLCAVVLEFFVCWTPLYVINTIALFTPGMVYNGLGYTAISFFHLLAYSSSCCNPITYCFMNSSFRKSFLTLFRCRRRFTSKNLSDVSVSESTLVSRSQKWLQDTRIYEEHL